MSDTKVLSMGEWMSESLMLNGRETVTAQHLGHGH